MCNECVISLGIRDEISFLDDKGKLHCLDGPAHIFGVYGPRFYYRHGALHRVGAPAVVWADGTIEYWVDGVHSDV